ncbi:MULTISPECIES: helix-turn-helix domain-containing protein [unclassified Frankia]|uniref:helix-turn-helix domain-containing protein n=1 Tax=unclassified Frankia TaxID=2632575 RepID=UPI001EF507BF|nr:MULTISPECIES: helix-turn-helix domain-containing protein [unclassified Frankia]
MSGSLTVERATYTIDEVAVILGVSRGVAYAMAKNGEIPAFRAGVRRWVVPCARFESWLSGKDV